MPMERQMRSCPVSRREITAAVAYCAGVRRGPDLAPVLAVELDLELEHPAVLPHTAGKLVSSVRFDVELLRDVVECLHHLLWGVVAENARHHRVRCHKSTFDCGLENSLYRVFEDTPVFLFRQA